MSSPMRSRVEIVARKSDHICVVRDVPDSRNHWYQRQHSHHMSRQDSQGAGSHSSLEHASSTASQPGGTTTSAPAATSTAMVAGAAPAAPAAPVPAVSAAPVAAVVTPATPVTPGVTSGGATPPKPSFAALFGRHPVIKEEPTTPGGSLLSETPSPGLGGGGKRSPLKLHASGAATAGAAGALTPAQSSSTDAQAMGQIITLLNDLKTELRNDIAQLARRVASIDKQQHQHQQLTPQTSSTLPVPEIPSPTTNRKHEVKTIAGTGEQQIKTSPTTGEQQQQVKDRSPTRHRERSKSPGRKHHSHHHHHHHHRKASHSTPTATPTATPSSSQVELAGPSPPEVTTPHTTPAASVKVVKEPTGSGVRLAAAGPTTTGGTRGSVKMPSFEQSDDDQDATSKL